MVNVFILLSICVSCGSQSSIEEKDDTRLFIPIDSERSGVDFVNQVLYQDSILNCFSFYNIYNGGGVAIGDLDNDGYPDLYFTGNQVEDKLYRNLGDLEFENVPQSDWLQKGNDWTTGVTMADVNGDNLLDIYVCRSGPFGYEDGKLANQCLINLGDFKFKNQAQELGLAGSDRTNHASFFDYDNDGDLDVYIVNHPSIFNVGITQRVAFWQSPDIQNSDKLLRNDGEAGFVDVTQSAGLLNYAFGLSVSVADFDNDGWQDIYVANDYSEPDHFYRNNQDGSFTDLVDEAFPHISQFSMGSDAADINNDGLIDLISLDMMAEDNRRKKTNMQGMQPQHFYRNVGLGRHFQYMQNMLHLNRDGFRFSDIAELAGVAYTDWSWAPLFADLDNDGLTDLFVTNGIVKDLRNNDFLRSISNLSPSDISRTYEDLTDKIPSEPVKNYAFKNLGNLEFDNTEEQWGLSFEGFSNGAAYGDLDLDGDLDIVVSNAESKALIYENTTENNNFLKIRLQGSQKNRFGFGGQVVVRSGQLVQTKTLTGSHGFLSSSEPVLHFGLGEEEKIDELKVVWPDGAEQIIVDLGVNESIVLNQTDAKHNQPDENQRTTGLFTKRDDIIIDYIHKEVFYDDFEKEILLPHRYSQNGPPLAVDDVNSDGLDDFFVGAPKESSGSLYLQNIDGDFVLSASQPWNQHKDSEDMVAQFFDSDADGDLDLYIGSGSNEWPIESEQYLDRLYINNGKGGFEHSANALPKLKISTSCAKPCDFDNDGDLDLFVGARLIPGKYPFPASSYLLVNNDGKYKIKDEPAGNPFHNLGMVTDAAWLDFDSDGDADLLIVGEWMTPTVFINDEGSFYKQEIIGHTGWWNCLEVGDFDGDGDLDFVAGNLGKNSKYQTKGDTQVEVFSGDFDGNGANDIVLAYPEKDVVYPVRGRSCSSQQMPSIANKFPSYDAFANSSVEDVYGEAITDSLHYSANWMSTTYFENKGGTFNPVALPVEAQFSTVLSIVATDINVDGIADLVLGGNSWQTEVETCKHDASYGSLLIGQGHGKFLSTPLSESGLFLGGDTKCIRPISIKGRLSLISSKNNSNLLVHSLTTNSP